MLPGVKPRPFRFGVQEGRVLSAREWRENARRIEAMGYAGIYSPDHFDDQLAPVPGLMAAADATTTLRVGSLVFDNDYRHPVVLAKEAATLDLLSDGRFDLGIGAGWMASDYRHAGIPYDSAGTRIERMEEALAIIKSCFGGEKFSFHGKHYTIEDFEATPLPAQRPHPPILMGGGGRKMLGIAAREADIVHINYNLGEGRINPALVHTGFADANDEKIAWVKEAAGERFPRIELGLTIFFANVTEDRGSLAEAIAPGMQAQPQDMLDMPFFLIGTIDQLVEQLQARRARYGISFVIVPGEAAEALAPVVERLAGN
jgi:probable F420-dependent oxidoreductase